MEKFENAKVGDKVWEIRYGWGKIVKVNKKLIYPIEAKFKNIYTDYTLGGKGFSGDLNPTLFWNEFEIPEENGVRDERD